MYMPPLTLANVLFAAQLGLTGDCSPSRGWTLSVRIRAAGDVVTSLRRGGKRG